jgi:hypothetical protein
MEPTLKRIDVMTDEELKIATDNCFEYATELTPVRRLSILLEAGFYTNELHRRVEEQAQEKRDGIETDRWRIDLKNEKIIIWMIAIEIGLSLLAIVLTISSDRHQSQDVERQLTESRAMVTNLRNLENSSGATADRLVEAKNALKTLNDKLQAEIDLYYEPSVTLEAFQQYGFNHIRILNNGRTRIVVFGVKESRNPRRDRPCKFEEPLAVPSAGSNVLTNIGTVQSVIIGGGIGKASIYFETANGEKYEHQFVVERVPIVAGKAVFIAHQNTIPIAWTPELKGALAGKCTE